ncbi:MAG: protein-arginine deiminase [Phycisphaerales bacterium]|jgi:hypothetical protein|nr:protein-arginine deiminase [Phycisphaerales bacterium]
MFVEQLESRRLMSLVTPLADLLVDANRDGVINAIDDAGEDIWTNGISGRGAVILPNIDKDNTTTGAPDNWTGGVWNGKPVAPNNVIDNAADLLDIGKLRLKKLGVDDAYNYRVTIRLLKPASDPAWLKNTAAADRVRIFFPTKQLANGDVVAQAGDIAVIGPGQADTIRFVANPAAVNEYNVMDLGSAGWMEFGIEGLKAGAQVRVRVTVEYIPIFETQPPTALDDVPIDPPPTIDEIAIRVAPFVLQDNRQAASRVFIENMNLYPGFDNAAARAVLKQAFGTRYAESKTGDLWQQDGYEIGYARTPTGQMPIVLELPRARNGLFDTVNTMRTFIRGSLLAAGVGVNIELASQLIVSASSFGGDIESLPRPGAPAGAPGFLVASGMPTYMKDFFAAQGVNPLLDLKLDDWLGIAHVDEVVQLASNGNKLLIADPDLAWALALWATKIDPNVRMLAKMNSNEGLPDYTAEGIKASLFLNNATFRKQNLQFAQSSTRLRGLYDAVKKAMKLTDELSAPLKWASATGTVSLLRGGAFTSMIGNVKRTFQVKFLDGDRYQLQYRDEGGAYSKWFEGRKSRDEVFTDAKAFLLKEYWTGTAKTGDRFTFTTNPAATLIKMPVLFATFGLLFDPPGSPPPVQPWRLGAFTTNHINSIVDGQTVVTGSSYGPRVNFDGSGVKKDLFDAYATSAFRAAGFTKIFFADARLYHDSSGSLHCGTNVIRTMPSAKWWEA